MGAEQSRSTFQGWKRYMRKNPIYFHDVFGERANIDAEAAKLFGIHKRITVVNKPHNRKPRPVLVGVERIAAFVGTSRDTVFKYIKRGMPTFMENRSRMAYEGRVQRWAKRHKVGRFA